MQYRAHQHFVIAAKAAIQAAFERLMDSRFRGNDGSLFGVTRKRTVQCLQRAIFNTLLELKQ
jgi:hypothetical protein